MTRTQISRWNPSTAWLAERDPFRLMEELFNGPTGRGEELSNRPWRPAVDIRENNESYVLSAELPGLTKDDVEITIENNVLKLSGERRFEKEVKEEELHRVERAYGSFSRAFSLPTRVDAERVEASFADGILTVTVPKAAEARPRKIDIA
ncbi:MAG TPA: Hsp20/alpha crystallin family protein [Thermoanaerobaculia bacterium]|nr:Hsp20/alpha crystallin family protein [Thermoanaerobaculia bacterium]